LDSRGSGGSRSSGEGRGCGESRSSRESRRRILVRMFADPVSTFLADSVVLS